MQKLVYIDACVREGDSRTRRIAEPIVAALAKKYEITAYHLAQMDIKPLNAESYAARVAGDIPEWATKAAKAIAAADAVVIAAPFWDMSIPAILKTFIEHTSLFGITFDSNDHTCIGLCRSRGVMYITTRGMAIPTGSPLDQGTSYIKAISRLWGLGDVRTIAAVNMDYSSPEEIEAKIAACIREGLELAPEF